MFIIATLISFCCKIDINKIGQSSVFQSGMIACICVFGVAWLGDTFVSGHSAEIKAMAADSVAQYPALLAVVFFIAAMLLYSQAATAKAITPAIVAALGLTAEDNNVLETAVKAIGDLADDAEAFDRDAAAESGTLADMIRELAGTLGDDSNPLVVSLDVIWGAISSSSIVTGADPDDDEDPIEHYLYDNSDLTGLMGAYWDLQGVLEIMFGELGMNADFRGSLI